MTSWVAPRSGGYTPEGGEPKSEPPTGPAAGHNVSAKSEAEIYKEGVTDTFQALINYFVGLGNGKITFSEAANLILNMKKNLEAEWEKDG